MLSPECQWFDNASLLSMQKQRWNYPNVDPATEGGAAEPTYEFYPSKGEAQVMDFMVKTSGLNAYALTYLMPSGKMLVQANYSTMLWDPLTNTETDLPDMPGQIIRVYPASGANAMLPLTPKNNWTPSVLFCGGSNMTDFQWGNYSWPFADTWMIPASEKCHQITPEPTDNSAVDYVEDDNMFEGRTMGQFIALPDQTMLLVNGGVNGTAGYSERTLDTLLYGDMPYGMSLASGPVGTPAIYNPNAPAGQRWSRAGFQTSNIARLYHSSALLLPDASVLIAGSNPNVDVNISTFFPTQYKAEIFYPSYFSAPVRPVPQGVPKTISYGGAPFDITIPASSYSGSANAAAANTTVMLMRPGWTTHGMNMGQRAMQLNNTYTVNQNGTLTLHVAQAPPNANLMQPGPALLFVVVSGIPSNGTMVIVGNGQFGTQPTSAASVLPESVLADSVWGEGGGGVGCCCDCWCDGAHRCSRSLVRGGGGSFRDSGRAGWEGRRGVAWTLIQYFRLHTLHSFGSRRLVYWLSGRHALIVLLRRAYDAWGDTFLPDSGSTGASLSRTSKSIRAASASVRFHSVRLNSLHIINTFILCYELAPEDEKPNVHHLLLTFLPRDCDAPPRRRREWTYYFRGEHRPPSLQLADDVRTWLAEKSVWNHDIARVLTHLFTLVAPSLRTLTAPRSASRSTTWFPFLDDPSDFNGVPADPPYGAPPFPALTHLHVVCPGDKLHPWEQTLPLWAVRAPALTPLRISQGSACIYEVRLIVQHLAENAEQSDEIVQELGAIAEQVQARRYGPQLVVLRSRAHDAEYWRARLS
ncbi:Galactose oxidase [Grifola frondosa]|uniref:Galactose oxidase n=1 Tax=Grifola frondosa TaxID=5627 RepID=A0A1C7LPG8_GRIFR|nr:Galactose oxidase [Grifola frondosa]